MSAERGARQIVAACRYGDPEVTLTLPARLGAMAHGLFPDATARVLQGVNAVLPSKGAAGSDESHSGWQSVSRLAPSFLTRSADAATRRNNEVPAAP